MEDGAVAPALRSVAERAIALAATGGWSAADLAAVVALLKALGRAEAQPTSGTIEIGDTDAAHATVFTLHRGGVIPLHDHPAMTVISKVLHGRMRVETFEWSDRDAGLARDRGARDVGDADDPLVFGPQPGTLHRITALTDCTFIDLFAPYYDDDRPCRYYEAAAATLSTPLRMGAALRKLEPTGEVAP